MQPESSKSTGPEPDGGETCGRSRQDVPIGDATSSAEVSHARTLAHATTERRALTANGLGSGLSLQGSFAHCDPNTSSLKTSQHSLFGGLIEFSGILPRAGMMRNGILYQRKCLALPNSETDFSLWPTPQASDSMRMPFSVDAHRKQQARNKRLGFGCGPAGLNLVGHCQIEFGGVPTANFVEWLMGFPINYTDTDASETP